MKNSEESELVENCSGFKPAECFCKNGIRGRHCFDYHMPIVQELQAALALANTKIAHMHGNETAQLLRTQLAESHAREAGLREELKKVYNERDGDICPACGTEFEKGEFKVCGGSIIADRDEARAYARKLSKALFFIDNRCHQSVEGDRSIASEALKKPPSFISELGARIARDLGEEEVSEPDQHIGSDQNPQDP